MKKFKRQIYQKIKILPIIGPIAVFLKKNYQDLQKIRSYALNRDYPEKYTDPEKQELIRIKNILNYTKNRSVSYSGENYPAGYHTIKIYGETLKGQRNPALRFANLKYNFEGKKVLDLGSNQGAMLFFIRDQIKLGVGIDCDYRMVNAANRIAGAYESKNNLFFFCHDLDKDPLELLQDLIPGGCVDIVFLLSVCVWLENWKSVIVFCARISKLLLFESNGSMNQQIEQERELRKNYISVELIADCSDDDPGQKQRNLYICKNYEIEAKN